MYPVPRNRYQRELQLAAHGLTGISSFQGDEIVGATGIVNSVPAKKKSPTSVFQTTRSFKLTVKNSNASEAEFYLLSSFLTKETDQGHPLSGKSIAGDALDFGLSDPQTLKNLKTFYRFIETSPIQAMSLRLQSTSPDEQYNTDFLITRQNAVFGGDPETSTLKLDEFYLETVQGARIIDQVPVNWSMDQLLEVKAKVAKASTFTVTIRCGVMVSLGEGVQRNINNDEI
jgi:hypothetical protein